MDDRLFMYTDDGLDVKSLSEDNGASPANALSKKRTGKNRFVGKNVFEKDSSSSILRASSGSCADVAL